ncbi:MAG: hypothetical protein Kow002_11090 [Anaerolineales bacterium]
MASSFKVLNGRLKIHDLVDRNVVHLEEYLKIYADHLPQYARYTPLMCQRAMKPIEAHALERWHQWLVMLDGEPAAMVGFLYNRKRNLGILMDFAVVEVFRDLEVPEQGRFAGMLLHLAMEQLKQDAAASGYATPLCMAAEVEHAPLVERYQEYGFVEFPIMYYEPPGTPELASIVESKNLEEIGYRRLHLGAFRIPGGNNVLSDDTNLIDIIIRALLKDHYQLSENHWLLERILRSIYLGDAQP